MKNVIIKQFTAIIIVILSTLQLQAESIINESFLKNINTDGDETSCALTGDSKFFIFARKIKGEKNSDLYFSEFKNKKWTAPKPAPGLNTDSDELSPFITEDGKFLLFSSDRPGSLKKSSSDKPSYDIYYSEKKGEEWVKPELLFGAVNTAENEFNPSMTKDGAILYFTRSPFNDSSRMTLVRVLYKNDLWEDVRTASISKNDTANIYMYKKASNRTGAFAAGFKKGDSENRDIFIINEQDNSISELSGLNVPVNSSGDEMSVTELNSDTVIISSNSAGIGGSYDFFIRKTGIETVKKLAEVFTVKIESGGFKNPDSVKIKTLFFSSLKKDSWPVRSEIKTPDKSGLINIHAESDIKRILIIPGQSGIKSFAVEFLTGNPKNTTATVKIEPSVEKEFTAEPVYFNFNSSEIKITDIPYIHSLIEYMRNNNSSLLTLDGYSDGVGSYKANLDISLRRAEKIKDYLVKAGIKKNRIKTKGFGYLKENKSDTAQYNRRVESTIINQ